MGFRVNSWLMKVAPAYPRLSAGIKTAVPAPGRVARAPHEASRRPWTGTSNRYTVSVVAHHEPAAGAKATPISPPPARS